MISDEHPPQSKILLFTADVDRLAGTHYLNLCKVQQATEPPPLETGVALWLDEEGLLLINAELSQPLRLHGSLLERRWQGKSLLMRACGLAGESCSVLDPFAGFGLDALTLVHYGCTVTTCEQQALVWLMQMDFAERMGMTLHSSWADGVAQMQQAQHRWDIVYLDPMFPARRKRALPNLALQHLQHLCGTESVSAAGAQLDVEACLSLAQGCAQRRVVLKRRAKDPTLGRPSHQLKGQAVRFDVYL